MGTIASRAGVLVANNWLLLLLIAALTHLTEIAGSNRAPVLIALNFVIVFASFVAYPAVAILLAHRYRGDTFNFRQALTTVQAHFGQYCLLVWTGIWQSFVIAAIAYLTIVFIQLLMHGEWDAKSASNYLLSLLPLIVAPMISWVTFSTLESMVTEADADDARMIAWSKILDSKNRLPIAFLLLFSIATYYLAQSLNASLTALYFFKTVEEIVWFGLVVAIWSEISTKSIAVANSTS